LAGPKGNPLGIGAVLRLRFGERLGAAREVLAGSGYWSQDSVVQVLATPATATGLWIRWPGGKFTVYDLPPNVLEISAGADGTLRVLRTKP